MMRSPRPKLIDISGSVPRAWEANRVSPTAVLFETSRRLHFASFTGKGDRAIVERMLAEFEYVIALALEQRSANVAAACWVSTATAARLAPQSSASRCNLQGSL